MHRQARDRSRHVHMSSDDSAYKMNSLAKSLQKALVCCDTSDIGETENRKIMATSNAGLRKPLDINSFDAAEFQVFANPLLFEKIAQHLNQPDMKALSETGILLQEMTRSCSLFAKKTQLNILNGSSATKNLDLLKSEIVPWTSVKLHVRKWEREEYQTIQDILNMPSVESLELEQEVTVREFHPSSPMQIPLTPEQVTWNNSVIRLITSTPNLHSLKLNVELLCRVSDLFASPEVQQCLRSLHSLDISISNKLAQTRVTKDFLDRDGDRYQNFTNNMICLASVSGMKLRTFKFQLNVEHERHGGIAISYVAAVVQLLVHNRSTLEELSLHGHVWSCTDLAQIQCSSLKSLDVNTKKKSCDGSNASNVAAFIEQQPFLRSLTLEIQEEIVGMLKRFRLPNVIMQRSSKLERLQISWNLDPKVLDWAFLQDMPQLKEFSLCQHERSRNFDGRSPVVQLLTHLPPSLNKLEIYAHARAPVSRPRIQGLESILISSLAKLTNLKVLDLMYGAPNTVSDTGLQFICSSMKQLQVLRLNRCDDLTDFGITGKRNGEDAGITLANLNRLQRLEIRKCENINFSTLLSVVSFPELKKLHLCVSMNWDDVRSTCQQIATIGTQNPRLQQLKIGNCYPRNSPQFSKEGIEASIQKRLPGFKELRLYASSRWPIGSVEAEYEEEVA